MGPESTNGKIVGVIFFCLIFVFGLSLSLSHLSLSLSLPLSLSFSLSASSLSLTPLSRFISLSLSLSLSLSNNYIHAYMCLTVGRQSRDHRPLSRDPSVSFYKKFPNCLKRPKNVVWQSADGRVTSDHCRVTVQRLFSKFSPNRLKRPKNVVWQSADGRVTSDHCRVTVQRLFSKKFLIAWNVEKSLFDSRPTVAWPPTTVTWPFSDFFQNFPKLLETSKKRCLTVGRRSRDLRPLSRDRSATFSKKISNCLKRRKIVVWQSADSRVTSDHCHVTVQRLFSK